MLKRSKCSPTKSQGFNTVRKRNDIVIRIRRGESKRVPYVVGTTKGERPQQSEGGKTSGRSRTRFKEGKVGLTLRFMQPSESRQMKEPRAKKEKGPLRKPAEGQSLIGGIGSTAGWKLSK